MSTVINNGKHHTININVVKLLFLFFISFSFSVTATTTKNEKVWVIVIDAGHGGKDPGAIGAFSYEKNIALAIALKTGEYIEQNIKNVTVIYTRKNDTFVELRDRATIANKDKADLFISIHANWAKSKSVQGTETYIMGTAKDQQNLEVAMKENEVIFLEEDYSTKYEGFDPKSDVSYIMFTTRQKEFQKQSTELAWKIQTQFREKVERRDRDVRQAGFWVLFATTMPSVLIETGFITNASEEKYLNSRQGQDYLSSAIARACNDYISEIDSKSNISWDNNQNTESKSGTLAKETAAASEEVVFMVQIATSTAEMQIKPENFKGLKDVIVVSAEERFKYASGRFTDYAEAAKYRKSIDTIYPDAFVIAVKDNKIVPLQKALDQKKKNKLKS